MISSHSRALTYLAAIGFIFSWWAVTLSSLQRAETPAVAPICPTTFFTSSHPFPHPFPPFVRAKWHRALTGDLRAMMELLAEWQVEAQCLEAQGEMCKDIPPFPQTNFLRAQELARRLLAREKGMDIPTPPYQWQEDDGGTPLNSASPPQRFLPQTELAAAILLTLCPFKQIVGLPARMRTLPLFPPDMLAAVPYDIDRHYSESLVSLKPDVAFIAHYTQPSTLQTLRQQQITPFLITRLNSLEEILDTILKIGHVVGQGEKAELLTLFVQAGLSTLDRRLAAHAPFPATPQHHPLYLQAFSTLYAPTQRSLAGQLAHRLKINQALDEEAGSGWTIPLSKEHIQHLAPTWIVFSLRDPQKNLSPLRLHPLLKGTPAALTNQIFAVEEAFQDSPTHFLLLAYYDLVALILPQVFDVSDLSDVSDDNAI